MGMWDYLVWIFRRKQFVLFVTQVTFPAGMSHTELGLDQAFRSLASDWSIPELWPLIGQCWHSELQTEPILLMRLAMITWWELRHQECLWLFGICFDSRVVHFATKSILFIKCILNRNKKIGNKCVSFLLHDYENILIVLENLNILPDCECIALSRA